MTTRPTPTMAAVGAHPTFCSRVHLPGFIEERRGDDPDLASYLRVEERELEAAELN